MDGYVDTFTLKTVTETSKTTNLQACFFYNTFLYWLTSLLIIITFLYQQDFQAGETKPTKQPNVKLISFIKQFYIDQQGYPWLHSFSLGKFFLSGKLCTNERVCLNTDYVCSINNWLSILISDNWILHHCNLLSQVTNVPEGGKYDTFEKRQLVQSE